MATFDTPARRDSAEAIAGGRTGSPDDKPNAARALRELILVGEFGPGDRLPPERELVQRLHVSRSSVREAIRELAALGILEARRGSGTYLAELASDDLFAPIEFALNQDPTWFFHLMELRRILEPAAASMAAVRLTAQDHKQLIALNERYTAEVATGHPDPAALVAFDEEIHDLIVEATGNPLFVATVRSLKAAARRGRQLTVKSSSTPRASAAEIRGIIDALIERNPLRAADAMTRHIHRLEAVAREALPTARGVDHDEADVDRRHGDTMPRDREKMS